MSIWQKGMDFEEGVIGKSKQRKNSKAIGICQR